MMEANNKVAKKWMSETNWHTFSAVKRNDQKMKKCANERVFKWNYRRVDNSMLCYLKVNFRRSWDLLQKKKVMKIKFPRTTTIFVSERFCKTFFFLCQSTDRFIDFAVFTWQPLFNDPSDSSFAIDINLSAEFFWASQCLTFDSFPGCPRVVRRPHQRASIIIKRFEINFLLSVVSHWLCSSTVCCPFNLQCCRLRCVD